MSIGTRIPFGNPESGKPKVLISIPNTGWVHKNVMQAAMQIVLFECVKGRVSGDLIMPTNNPFENNLHHIVNDILKRDYDYWISFDSDNPPIKNPVDLIFLDKDIIGCPTPIWHHTGEESAGERPLYYNVYDYVPEEDAYKEHRPCEGLQYVEAIGTGCFVVARRVLEHPDMQKGCFTRKLNADGTVNKGNDISFCERAKECHFEIYAHYGYPCNQRN